MRWTWPERRVVAPARWANWRLGFAKGWVRDRTDLSLFFAVQPS
jgi:hypothetical protein